MTDANPLDLMDAVIREDPDTWLETHGSIVLKNGDVVEPGEMRVNHMQRLMNLVRARCMELGIPCRILNLKPRQKGSTTKSGGWCYHDMRRKRTSACVIGGQYSQTQNAWEIIQHYHKKDSFAWGNHGAINSEKGEFSNGSKLVPETAGDKDAARSGTFQFLFATEVARWAKEGVVEASKILGGALKCVPLLPDTTVILETTAYGACYDDQTEVLTDQGWKLFRDLTGNESILTKDPVTNVAYYQPKWIPQIHRWNGELIDFTAETVRLSVTPNHMMWMARQKGKMKFSRADSVIGKSTDYYFERGFKWDRTGPRQVTIPAYTHNQGVGTQSHRPVAIPIRIWLRFLGHWLSDGNVRFKPTTKHVVLTQTKYPDKFQESITAVAECFGVSVRIESHGRGKRFVLCNAQLAAYLKDFAQPKRIPRDLLLSMSREQCRTLLEAIHDGDGCNWQRSNAGIDRGQIYVGVDKELQDDVQELALKAGYASNALSLKPRNRKTTFTSSLRANLRTNNPPTVRRYDGYVYCVTLPKDHLLFVRKQGIAVWCGNSGDYYNRWLDAVDVEDFLAGKVITPGDYIRIFTPWFVFEDSAIKLTPQQKIDIQLSLDKEAWYNGERELIEAYGNSNLGYTRLGDVVTGFDVWEQLAWRRQMIKTECKKDPEVFNEDYPHSWETAFLKSGRRRFNSVGLKQLDANVKRKAITHGILDEQRGSEGVVWRNCSELESWFWKWEEPRVGRRYLISADTMTGATQVASADDPDCHGVFVWRAGYFEHGRGWVPPAIVCRIAPPCRWDIDILEDRVWRLARYYGGRGGCLIAPEINMDRGLVELLKKRNANIYVREMFNRTEQTTTKAYGWQTTPQTREMLVETMAKAIREQGTDGEGLDVWCPHFTLEAKNFIVKASGRSEADTGHHDDDIIGGAIGLQVIAGATELVEEVYARPLPPDIQRWEDRRGHVGNTQFT